MHINVNPSIRILLLCLTLLIATTTSIPSTNIFFLHTSMETKLSLISSCAIESAARSNPTSTITLYTNGWTTTSILQMPPNVRIKPLNPTHIFRHLPTMKQWYRKSRTWKKGFPLNNLSNALRLAIILKQGGTYLDTDMVVVKPLSEAPSNAVGIEVEVEVEVENNEENNETPSPKIHISKQINGVTNTTTINTAAFINFEKNNPFVQKLVDRFVQEYNGELWGHNGPGLLTRTWQDYDQNTNDLHLMSKKYLYPIGWHEIDQLFDPIHMHENIVRLVSGSSFAVHMWQSLLIGHIKYADENSVLSHLFKFACPTTHETLFVPTRLPLLRMMPFTLSQFTAP